MLEAVAVEDGFLHTGHEPESQVLGDLANLAQERQVQHQVVVLTRTKVVEELVHHQQHAVVRVYLAERGHHLLEAALLFTTLSAGGNE